MITNVKEINDNNNNNNNNKNNKNYLLGHIYQSFHINKQTFLKCYISD